MHLRHMGLLRVGRLQVMGSRARGRERADLFVLRLGVSKSETAGEVLAAPGPHRRLAERLLVPRRLARDREHCGRDDSRWRNDAMPRLRGDSLGGSAMVERAL